jgi:LPS-assembly protein
LFGWLTVTPRVGGRFTYYSEADGPGATTTEQERWVFNTGAEVSFKLSRVWPGAHSRLLELNGVRHILQPLFNYVYVPEPSVLPPELPQFDSELPSFRPLPLNFPDYNALDSIDAQHVVRLGLRNKVQTKREGGIDHVLNWELFTDWRIQPRDDQNTFSDVYSLLDLKPRSWLTLTSEIRYDVDNWRFRMANHYLTLQPNARWSVALGHRYLRDEPALGPDSGNDLYTSTLYYRLNENWGFRMSHHYEAKDGVMEEQQYTVYRDLRSWTAALTCRLRDQRSGGNDWSVALTFSLKAFPRYQLGDDTRKPTLLLGY